MKNKIPVYLLYILLSCLFTAGLNIVHTLLFLKIPLTPITFLVPMIAGIIFGSGFSRIKFLNQKLIEISHTDSLTQTYNPLYFNKILDLEINKVKRYGSPFSIIFFDLDHFKKINDTFGHPVGDKVLRSTADIVSFINRSTDIFARYGGEEFIILAPSTRLEGALVQAERLRQDIENYNFPVNQRVTSSFGVAEFNPEKDNRESIIKRADKALYLAKKKGRNRVEAIK